MIILKLAQSPQSFDELKTLTQLESRSIKEHIIRELRQERNKLAHKHYCQKFLKSLWFSEIHRRQETVVEAHRKTFQWIFETDTFSHSARRWHNFVQWLREGDGIYWISGKAGSGKSTLMNYICQDHRTADALKAWSGTKEVLIPNYFFWNAGAALEKTSEGLLRSLLYQILERFPCLIPLPYGTKSTLEYEDRGPEEFPPISAWTKSRLRSTLRNAMLQLEDTCRICVFVDGLDESSDETESLIEVVQDMLSANVKICVSSRPDRSFLDAFDSAAHLRLQDLTMPDIKTYVHDKLQLSLQKRSADEHEVSQILDSIAVKAQGVFLWVRLVVKTLSNGLRDYDSLNQLRARVESTPADIETMYEKMLSSIDVAHRKEAALLFLMALNSMTDSLLDITYVLYKEIYHVSIESGQSAVLFSRQALKRIPEVGAGLLEIKLEDRDCARASEIKNRCHICYYWSHVTLPLRYACSSEMTDLSYYERYAHVEFIHRTAIDFLRQSQYGQSFLKEHTAPCFSLNSTYAKGLLAKVDSLGFPEKPNNIDPEFYEVVGLPADFYAEDRFDDYVDGVAGGCVDEVMRRISKSEEEGIADAAHFSLCDDVDNTLAIIYQRHRVDAPIPHWVMRWRSGYGSSDRRPSFARYSRRTSLSSSSESFHSARCEPTLFSREPIDFLGLASCWGLSRYVQRKLVLQSNRLDETYMNYLLCCSVPLTYLTYSTGEEWDLRGHQALGKLKLTTELLDRGGNPNAYLEDLSTTIWGISLYSWDFLQREPDSMVGVAIAKASAITAEAFINAGADIPMKRLYGATIFIPDFHHEIAQVSRAVKCLSVVLRVEASPLYTVQRMLETASEWRTVGEIISAKGGCIFHKYTRAAVSLDRGEIYEISRGQREELLEALNLAHDECFNRPNFFTDWIDLRQKICREKMISFADSNNQRSSDEGVFADDDAEGEIYEALDTQAVEDAQNDHLHEQ